MIKAPEENIISTHQPLGTDGDLSKLVVYVDAAHANLSDGGSQ